MLSGRHIALIFDRIISQNEDAVQRVLIEAASSTSDQNIATDPPLTSPSLSPPPPPSSSSPFPQSGSQPPSPSSNTNDTVNPSSHPSENQSNIALILATVIGGSVLIFMTVIGIIFYRSKMATTVKPWATGLSGQLQKAFITGKASSYLEICSCIIAFRGPFRCQ